MQSNKLINKEVIIRERSNDPTSKCETIARIVSIKNHDYATGRIHCRVIKRGSKKEVTVKVWFCDIIAKTETKK